MQKTLKRIGAKIRSRRDELQLTQEKLAELVEADPSYVGLLEAEKRTPSIRMLEKLAVALDVEIYEFFLPEDFTPEVDRVVARITREANRLAPDRRRVLLQIAEQLRKIK